MIELVDDISSVESPAIQEAELDAARAAKRLEKFEGWLLSHPSQPKYEMKHSFGPGVYLREILMFKDTLLIGHEHLLEHFNMVLSGKALVMMGGETEEISGPCYFKSAAGVRKVLYILEDMRWVTIHPNPSEERDIEKLEDIQIRKSDTWLNHHAEIQQFVLESKQRSILEKGVDS